MQKLRYKDFEYRVDVEAWEAEIGFDPRYVKGDEAVGQCLDPWALHTHGDRTGKLAINRDKRLVNCWVCGGGSLLSYTMALKNMDEIEATDWLYQFTRPQDETNEEYLTDIDRILFEAKAERKALPYFNENVLLRWLLQDVLDHEEYTDFLRDRGIRAGVAEKYMVCFNPELTRHSSKGDFVGPAVVFPHRYQGRLVGWQSRWLCEYPDFVPKYVFTNDFPRDESVYGYGEVYLSSHPVIVVESVPTVLFLVSQGYPAVSTFGSSVTPAQVKLLRTYQQGVIVAPDNDKGGDQFENKLVRGLEPYINVRVTERVPGEKADLGDLVEHPEILKMLIEEATIPGF